MTFAARWLDIQPWREEAHHTMMQLLARTGQRSAALKQYETARRVLGQEFGVEPGAATLALYGQIRADAFAPIRQLHRRRAPNGQRASFAGHKAGPRSGPELEDAETLLGWNLERFRQAGDRYGLGLALIVLALTVNRRGLLAQARCYFEEGVEILQQGDAYSTLPMLMRQVGQLLL
jgi:hypothetical protein